MKICQGLILFSCIALFLFLTGCSDSSNSASALGYVEAEWVYVASPQSGWLVETQAREGDLITIGEVLFQLDSSNQSAALTEAEARLLQSRAELLNLSTGARPAEIRALEAKLAEANARLVQAESEQTRIIPLVNQGIETNSRGEQVEANFEMAKAAVSAIEEEIIVANLAAREGAVEAARAGVLTAEAGESAAQIRLEEREIRALIAGSVEKVFRQKGEYVTTGAPVIAILPEDGLKIKFFVTQAELPVFEIGQVVRAKADGMTEAVDAMVSYISVEAEYTPPVIYSNEARDKLVFMIEATVPASSGLRPGLPVDVDWL